MSQTTMNVCNWLLRLTFALNYLYMPPYVHSLFTLMNKTRLNAELTGRLYANVPLWDFYRSLQLLRMCAEIQRHMWERWKEKSKCHSNRKKSKEQMGADGGTNNEELSFLPCDGIYPFSGRKIKHYRKLIAQRQKKSRGIRLGGTALRHLLTT